MKRIYKSQLRGLGLYFAGMYSLIFLPVLSIGYLAMEGTFKRYSVLEVIIWDPQLHYDHPDLFHYEFHPDIEFVEFKLTGNKEQDEQTLQQAEHEIIELKNTRNTSKGVHFHYDETAKYWSWIKANDFCSYEKTGLIKYTYNNEIWVFNRQPEIARKSDSEGDDKNVLAPCGGIDYEDEQVKIRDEFLVAQETRNDFILERIENLAIPGVLFLMMVLFTIRKIRLMN